MSEYARWLVPFFGKPILIGSFCIALVIGFLEFTKTIMWLILIISS